MTTTHLVKGLHRRSRDHQVRLESGDLGQNQRHPELRSKSHLLKAQWVWVSRVLLQSTVLILQDPRGEEQACKGGFRSEVDQYAYVPSVQQQRSDEKMMAKRIERAKKEASRRRREGRLGEMRVEESHGKATRGRDN
ncbi:hypothetical protein N7G274_001190 [Stereocaulon virgatum]|uniref:Uncharacterized protein n=1 Tax=Stereocaulon virgatum TaxID=373712 RepID=A0ABR4ANR2_9LECA